MTNKPTPVYLHLYERLSGQLRCGEIPPGQRLPSERQLAEELQISRMTARAAVDLLVQRGLVERRDRAGIYAARPKIEQRLSDAAGLSQQLLRRGVRPGARVLEKAKVRAGELPGEVTAALELRAADLAFKVMRVRTGDDEPLALEETYFPAERCAGLLNADLSGSVYGWLETHRGLKVGRSRQILEPSQLDAAAARLLSTHPNSPVLRVIRTAWTADGVPFEYARDLYRADRIQFVVETDNAWLAFEEPQ